MARITVEDCLDKLDNRFDLVLVSSKRARQLATGGKDALLEWENDKPTVMALREIAAGLVDRSILNAKPESSRQANTAFGLGEQAMDNSGLGLLGAPPPMVPPMMPTPSLSPEAPKPDDSPIPPMVPPTL